ncbi:hypothetical protein VTN77DRAFT_5826 [Rasamsonia byssochlamydoides]|uniref:uncharacterized protein n=1 Tax=Rasamsonia byssochlamydoides TaxID=89139 RepID=UPI003742F313
MLHHFVDGGALILSHVLTQGFEDPIPTDRSEPQCPSPIWKAAIDRDYEELRKGGIKGPAIDQDLWNIKSPTVNTIVLGMNGQVAAVIWGSIRLILKFAQPVLPELLDMFEELGRALPRFRKYEQELPMTNTLENALSDVYTEIIVFCAHSITFCRNNPNIARSRHAWSQFSSDFSKAIANLRSYSRVVDETADMIRFSRETHTAETIQAIKGLQALSVTDLSLPCYMIPYGLNLRFFGRESEIQTLKSGLEPQNESGNLRVMAIYGLERHSLLCTTPIRP